MSYFMTTARLGFRHWTRDDLPLATALWTDPEVMRYMAGPHTPEQVDARLDAEMERQERLGIQYWPIFNLATGEHAGCAGLRPPVMDAEPGVLEIGIHIARPYWSGRFGEEAARSVIRWGFAHRPTPAVVAGHGPGNTASQALILRLGFRYVGIHLWQPSNLPCPFYRLDRNDYRAPPGDVA